jgi:hypothetical protein
MFRLSQSVLERATLVLQVLAKVYDFVRLARETCRSDQPLKKLIKHAALMLRDLLMIQSCITLGERSTGPLSLDDLKNHMSEIFQRDVDAALLSELSLSYSRVVIAGGRRPEFEASKDTSKPPVTPRAIEKCLDEELNGVYRWHGSLNGK